MSTFTIVRYVDECYEAFSWSQLQWSSFWTFCHCIQDKEFLSFQSIYDPRVNVENSSLWLQQDYKKLKEKDSQFYLKQVITSNKGVFNVYNGPGAWPNVYSRVGKNWCCAGNMLEKDNYDNYFTDTILEYSKSELIEGVLLIPVQLDKRTKNFISKGNYFEYTLFNTTNNQIIEREVSYNKDVAFYR